MGIFVDLCVLELQQIAIINMKDFTQMTCGLSTSDLFISL